MIDGYRAIEAIRIQIKLLDLVTPLTIRFSQRSSIWKKLVIKFLVSTFISSKFRCFSQRSVPPTSLKLHWSLKFYKITREEERDVRMDWCPGISEKNILQKPFRYHSCAPNTTFATIVWPLSLCGVWLRNNSLNPSHQQHLKPSPTTAGWCIHSSLPWNW